MEAPSNHPELYESALQDVRWHLATLADEHDCPAHRWAIDCLTRVEYVLGIPAGQSALVLRQKARLGTAP